MIKNLSLFILFFITSFLMNGQCGPFYFDGNATGPMDNLVGMSFTTNNTCGGTLTNITLLTSLGSPNPNATVTMRLYEGNGLGGNVLGELPSIAMGVTIYDFSMLMISLNPSTEYTFIIEKDDPSDVMISTFGVVGSAPYTTGTAYWDGVPFDIKTPFRVNINNSTLGTVDFDINVAKQRVYPNPATNTIQITELKQQENYMVFDVSGQKVLEGVVNKNKVIDIKSLNKGVYFIKLKEVFFKLIKE